MHDFMAVQKILKEDTKITVEASEEDVTLYAEQLGIDVSKEKHLLWIAKKGLETPVPTPWCPVEDEKGQIYYYNRVTDKSSWEHPVDDHFRKLVQQERDKCTNSKEDTELGIESELSSLDDVPPITSGKNSMSALLDENNLKSTGKKMGSLRKLHVLGKEEKSGSTSYLKSDLIGDKFGTGSFIGDTKHLGKSNSRNDPLIKVTDDTSFALNHTTDDELSTGLDGIGFDRFAEQYGIMDASRLSPVMLPSKMERKDSYLKLASQPVPKSLLKTLFNTSNDLDETLSEEGKDGELSFADFLKEAEEYSNKALNKEKPESSLEEKSAKHNATKNISTSLEASINAKEHPERVGRSKKQNSASINDEKFKQDILAIENNWKRKLEEKEEEMRLDYEKHVAELHKKLEEERKIEEMKLNDSILLMKEENAVLLSKQEQVLTEELEGDLESAKEEIEAKKLAALEDLRMEMEAQNEQAIADLKSKLEQQHKQALKAIQDQEEEHVKEFEKKEIDAKETFESKVQCIYLEMEKKLEEKKQEIHCNHQQEIDALTKEHAKDLEELKNKLEQMDDPNVSNEATTLKEELATLKEKIETQNEALKQTQIELEEHQFQLSQLLQEEKILKQNNKKESERKSNLLQEQSLLQNQVIVLKSEITDQNIAIEQLTMKKHTLESELALIQEELISNKQRLEHLPTFVDKVTDTCNLLFDLDNVSERKRLIRDEEENSLKDELENDSENVVHGRSESCKSKEDKMTRLEAKMDILERAFRLLEVKIGAATDPSLPHDDTSHKINKTETKTDQKCEHCSKAGHTNSAPRIVSSVHQLVNSEQLNNSPYFQNAPDNNYSVFCMPSNTNNLQYYDSNLVYNGYPKGTSQQQMGLPLSPIYISEGDTELLPFLRSDATVQLEHCKEQFKNLQAKHEMSELDVELIKKGILSDLSRKDADDNKETNNLSYQQISDPYNASQLGSPYAAMPELPLANVITLPATAVQNDKWYSAVWQRAQQLIQKNHEFKDDLYSPSMIKEREENALDQFLTLTETVLDKELGLLSSHKIEENKMSFPTTAKEGNVSNNKFISLEYNKFNDPSRKNVTFYPSVQTNYKPMHLHQSTPISDLIIENDNWTEKIGNMYRKIRAYERDLVLRRSLKTNV